MRLKQIKQNDAKIARFAYIKIRCNGQKVGYFRDDLFKWTKSRLFF